MDFAEKMKELIARDASIDEIASSFGLDVNVLPPEWILFFSNSMMLTCSMMTQLESFNTKMEGDEREGRCAYICNREPLLISIKHAKRIW